ncbi:hypothetical protein DDE18_17290 [Nocardioides gansuensis]|uniref:histidine kinase n=1 Tax=Nocardioides gansuensis TaxID=2138300 RepID=A0A2T8F7R1_9ACTN|nr:HAMP domain-containing sensor histidine kinase [Nocardioides gansuensis]PVG81729.1 hypothetical protein DDE18_17290 [Nocardioides gansuensis]
MLFLASLVFYFFWRVQPTSARAWTVGAAILLATQVLARAGIDSATQGDPLTRGEWRGVLDLATCAVTMALLIAASRTRFTPDPLLLGVGLGVLLSAGRVIGLFVSGPHNMSEIEAISMAAVVLLGYVVLGREMWRDAGLPRASRARLSAATVLIGIGHVTSVWTAQSWLPDAALNLAITAVAFLWLHSALLLLGRAFEDQRDHYARLERDLDRTESDARHSRELLHEVRSMVAGIACATRLLHDHDIHDTVRLRLELTLRAELARLERLLSERHSAESAVDLDRTLDVVFEAHRARGRMIEWQPSGAHVRCRPDDVAEVMDILLDNAATHGQGSASRIEVSPGDDEVRITVTDHGPGVPDEVRDHLFDWGVRGSRSPGEGIGLHRARQLLAEQGGQLTLAHAEPDGSSFVIRLPAARTPEDDDDPAGR